MPCNHMTTYKLALAYLLIAAAIYFEGTTSFKMGCTPPKPASKFNEVSRHVPGGIVITWQTDFRTRD